MECSWLTIKIFAVLWAHICSRFVKRRRLTVHGGFLSAFFVEIRVLFALMRQIRVQKLLWFGYTYTWQRSERSGPKSLTCKQTKRNNKLFFRCFFFCFFLTCDEILHRLTWRNKKSFFTFNSTLHWNKQRAVLGWTRPKNNTARRTVCMW